jgi:hypothetical protein
VKAVDNQTDVLKEHVTLLATARKDTEDHDDILKGYRDHDDISKGYRRS